MQATVARIGNASPKRRNSRVTSVSGKSWAETRMLQFRRNVRFASSAKATRTALEVTQTEVAEAYSVHPITVCIWESGKYNWSGGEQELFEYMTTCREIANA